MREDRVDQRESGRGRDGTLAHGDVGHEMAGLLGISKLCWRLSLIEGSPVHDICDRLSVVGGGDIWVGNSPMCSHSAPPLIILLHSAVS